MELLLLPRLRKKAVLRPLSDSHKCWNSGFLIKLWISAMYHKAGKCIMKSHGNSLLSPSNNTLVLVVSIVAKCYASLIYPWTQNSCLCGRWPLQVHCNIIHSQFSYNHQYPSPILKVIFCLQVLALGTAPVWLRIVDDLSSWKITVSKLITTVFHQRRVFGKAHESFKLFLKLLWCQFLT